MKDYSNLVKSVGRGNRRSPTPEQVKEIKKLRGQGYTVSSIAITFGKSRNTVAKYLNT